jgi:UDP-2,3-diacylglucosamine pyrophosphatase LpxH
MNTFVQKLLNAPGTCTEVIFIPGNHDEALRDYLDSTFGNIHLHLEYEHLAANGRRYLVLHGDQFDVVTKYHRWLAVLGDHSYAMLVRFNVLLSWVRRQLGIGGYWSLAGYAKRKVKTAVSFICDYEEAVARHVDDRVSTASSAGTFMPRRSSRSTALPISTAATGWTVAPRSWSTSTGAWS